MTYIGTAGYSYKDWVGPFYPAGTKDGAMLEYYAANFDFVELNSTYYHMPGRRLFDSLVKRTGGEFKVAVKIFGGFTHERNIGLPEAEGFMEAMKPLTDNGRLVCLLAQFPYSFHCTAENADHLKRIREWFPGLPINVEFRNQKWIQKGTMDFLKKEGLGFVCVDEPALQGLVKDVTALTSDIAYIRMHGRNAAKWYGSEGADRYNYLYSIEELDEWAPRIRELERNASITVVTFNNHPIGKAVENARMLRQLLE